MKKLLLGAALAAVFAGSAQAGLWKSIATSDWETKPSAHYKVEALGFDVRAYEWTPEYNENVRCVFVAGADGNGNAGVACYPVETNDKD